MKMNCRLLGVAALFASLSFVAAGDITGKITLNGKPPAEKPLPLDPTEPREGANGTIPALSMSVMYSISSTRTPETPFMNALIRSTIAARTTSAGK